MWQAKTNELEVRTVKRWTEDYNKKEIRIKKQIKFLTAAAKFNFWVQHEIPCKFSNTKAEAQNYPD